MRLGFLKWLLLKWLAGALWAQTTPAPPAAFAQINEILVELGKMTGLAPPKQVASDVIDKKGLKKFLEDRIKDAVKPEDIHAEEVTLKKLGFVPQDFDLKETTVDLLTEQAAAFYDFRKKKLFLMEATPSLQERTLLVHELGHALADFHFNLQKYIVSSKDDDSSLARQAVMEGEATWLMSESVVLKTGQSLKKQPGLMDMMDRSVYCSSGAFPVFDKVPLYLRESLLFPYSKGMRFQEAVILKMGDDGFAEVFRNPPTSTQQILHPEKYFAKEAPTKPVLPKLADHRHYKEVAAGNIGEFDHSVLLKQYKDEQESKELSPRWRGGVYRISENKKDKRTVLQYATDWEDEASAKRYFADYHSVLAGKWKKLQISEETHSLLRREADDGYFPVPPSA